MRESLFTRSRLSKYLAEDVNTKDRKYIEIDDEIYHRENELPNKLARNSEHLHQSDKSKDIFYKLFSHRCEAEFFPSSSL